MICDKMIVALLTEITGDSAPAKTAPICLPEP